MDKFLLGLLLFTGLGDNNWYQREASTQLLYADNSYSYLKYTSLSTDPEVIRLLNTIPMFYSQSYVSTIMALVKLHLRDQQFSDWPWIDSLPNAHEGRHEIINVYTGLSRQLGEKSGGPNFPIYRYATELYLIDLIKEGQEINNLKKLIDQMIQGDRQQCLNGHPNMKWAGPGKP